MLGCCNKCGSVKKKKFFRRMKFGTPLVAEACSVCRSGGIGANYQNFGQGG
jgi:hypothetical protein